MGTEACEGYTTAPQSSSSNLADAIAVAVVSDCGNAEQEVKITIQAANFSEHNAPADAQLRPTISRADSCLAPDGTHESLQQVMANKYKDDSCSEVELLPQTKLELLSQRETDLFVYLLIAATFIALLTMTLAEVVSDGGSSGTRLGAVDIVNMVFHLGLLFGTASMIMLYIRRCFSLQPREQRVHQQRWVLMLLIGFYLSAGMLAWFEEVVTHERYGPLARYSAKVTSAFSIAAYYLYWMLNTHWFRLLTSELPRNFYWPKVTVCVGYYVVRTTLQLVFDFPTFTAPVTYAVAAGRVLICFNHAELSAADYQACYVAIGLAGLDIIIALQIVWSMHETRKVLRDLPFFKYRSKMLGFRAHVLQIYVLWTLVFVFTTVSVVIVRSEVFIVDGHGHRNFNGNTYLSMGIGFVAVAWAFVQAHIHLPLDTHHLGLRGWLYTDTTWSLDNDLKRLPTYSLRRSRSRSTQLRPHFSLEDCVEAFNLSAVAYRSPSAAVEVLASPEAMADGGSAFTCVGHIVDIDTDTHVYILSSIDKIAVTFRGTSSLNSLATDLRLGMSPVDESMRHLQPGNKKKVKECRQDSGDSRQHSCVMKAIVSKGQVAGRHKADQADTSASRLPHGGGAVAVSADSVSSACSFDASCLIVTNASEWADSLPGPLPGYSLEQNGVPPAAWSRDGSQLSDTANAEVVLEDLRAGGDYTQAARQVVDNIRERATRKKTRRVHSGFYMAWRRVAREVLSLVSQERVKVKEPRPVLVTGHSLGGALAVLCAYDMRVAMGIPAGQITVYTFGSPRIGNSGFTTRFNELVPVAFRVVNNRDMVTKLPMQVLGFTHVGTLALFDAQSHNLLLDPSWAEVLFMHNRPFGKTSRHTVIAYKASITGWTQKTHSRSNWTPPFWPKALRASGIEEAVQQGSLRQPMKRLTRLAFFSFRRR
eukprot:jgi/Chlat1/5180/Chrsp33S05158